MAGAPIRFGEEGDLAGLVFRVAERTQADFEAATQSVGLPAPLARALVVLASGAPMRALAEHMACDPSYVTALADQLEERGLVVRVAGADRRMKLLEVTAAGHALRDRLIDAIGARAALTNRLSLDERRALARLLERVLDDDAPGRGALGTLEASEGA